MKARWRVLVSAPYMIPFPEEYRRHLEEHDIEVGVVQVNERLDERELLPLIADVDGVICGDDEFTARVLEGAPRLKIISKWGTGIDSIDRKAAARLDIKVGSTPDAFTDAVADSTLGYVLAFARKLPWMDGDVRSGRWRKPSCLALKECNLGVIGVGHIGKTVVKRAVAFGMRVLGNDIEAIEGAFVERTGLEVTDKASLLRQSDFVTLHCDLNATSYHLMDGGAFDIMRPSSILINTARGSIVDEAALVHALRTRKIAGAALDVFEIEPLPESSPLRTLSNVLLAPHNSNNSVEARRRVHENTIHNLLIGLGVQPKPREPAVG